MYNLSKIIITGTLVTIVISLLFTGCGKPYPKEPTDVMVAFMMALIEQDYEGAKRYCTKNFLETEFNPTQSIMKTMFRDMATPKQSTSDKKAQKEADEFLHNMFMGMMQSEMSGDTAKVWMSGMDFSKTVLVREGAKWKIDRTETSGDASEIMKQFQNLGK